MHSGQTIKAVAGKGPPLLAPELGLVAALRASCIKFSGDKSLQYWTEDVDGTAVVEHVWTFDGDSKATFNVPQGTETVDLNEFRKRFNDLGWCERNPQHPIAYMRAMWDHLTLFREHLRGRKPHTKLSRTEDHGDRVETVQVFIPPDASEADKAEMIARFHGGGE